MVMLVGGAKYVGRAAFMTPIMAAFPSIDQTVKPIG